MFNLMKIIEGMTPMNWVIAVICLVSWALIIHFAGAATEKRWGDRETGALAGFFIPGFFLVVLLYLF